MNYNNPEHNSLPGYTLLFPLKIGNVWEGRYGEYFAQRLNSSIKILDRNYSNSYLLSVKVKPYNARGSYFLSVSPDIGLLSSYYYRCVNYGNYEYIESVELNLIKFIKA